VAGWIQKEDQTRGSKAKKVVTIEKEIKNNKHAKKQKGEGLFSLIKEKKRGVTTREGDKKKGGGDNQIF